jgi:hypothetical protein
MREARIGYSRDPNQALLHGAFENEIVLSDEFFREVTAHSIPTDLEAAKALSSAPAALDLFMWLSYRCFTAKCATEEILRAPRAMARFGSLALARLPGPNYRGRRLYSDSAGYGVGRKGA